jgi:hypothetical protein
MFGIINAKIVELQINATLNLAGGAVLNQTGTGAGEGLIINSGSTLNMSDLTTASTVTVNGDLIAGSGTISVGSLSTLGAAHILDLKGANNALGTYSVTNSGPANSNAIVKYSGTNQQVFTSSNYQNLEIAGLATTTKTLQGATTINKELKLNQSLLNIAAFDLTIGGSATIVNGGGSGTDRLHFNEVGKNNYIITGGGLLKKQFTMIPFNFVFPIGTGTTYSPMVASITGGSISGTPELSMKPINVNTGIGIFSPTLGINRSWSLLTTGFTGITGIPTGTLKFYYDNADNQSGTPANYVDGYKNGTNWIAGSTSNINIGTNEITFPHTTVAITDWGNKLYTAGELAAFIPTYYSRNAALNILTTGADWNLASTWSTDATLQHGGGVAASVPPAGATVVIAANHKIDVNTTSINVATLSLGGELNLRTLSHTLPIITDNGTNGLLKIGGQNSATAIASTTGSFFTAAAANNKVEFYGNTYNLPLRDYPTLNIAGNALTLTGGGSVNIFGNLNMLAGITGIIISPNLIFPNTGILPHLITGDVITSSLEVVDMTATGNVELSGICTITNKLTVNANATFTNRAILTINNFTSGDINGAGNFVNTDNAILNYASNNTPSVTGFTATVIALKENTVNYYGGTASPRIATYDKLLLRDTRTTTLGIINANSVTLDQNAPRLNLADNFQMNITNDLSLIGNVGNSILDFGTGSATVTVGGNLIAFSGTTERQILHSAGANKTQILELRGSSNELDVFTTSGVTGTGRSIVKYFKATPQTVFASPNYKEVEIVGGGIKSLQGNTTINTSLTFVAGIVDLGTGTNILTLGTNATIGGTTSNTNFIATRGTGTVNKQVLSSGTFTFPIGFGTAAANYAPVTANYIATGGGISAKVTGTLFPTTPAGVASKVNAMWSVNQSGLTLGNLTFNWDNAAVTGSLTSTALVYRNNAGVWTTPTADANTSNVISPSATPSATLTNSTNKTGDFAVFAPLIYYSKNINSNWTVSTDWAMDAAGTIAASPFPISAGANVVIQPTHTATNVPTITLDEVQIDGTLDINLATSILTANKLSGGGVLQLNSANLPVVAVNANNTFIDNVNSTVAYYNGVANIPATFNTKQYQNLTILSGVGQASLAANTNILGNLNINGRLLLQGFTLTGVATKAINIASSASLVIGSTASHTNTFPTGFTVFGLNANSYVEYNGDNQMVAGLSYGNLSLQRQLVAVHKVY